MSSASLTVDQTGRGTLAFVDDKGDTNAAAPAGVQAAFASDNLSVATVAADPAAPLACIVTPVAEGTANVTVTLTDANGAPLVEADGVTPWAPVDPAALTIGPGSAVGAQFSITQA